MKAIRNKVQLIGRINLPTITVESNNLKVAELRIQTEETYRNKEGEKVQGSMWHRCKAYGKLAEIVDKYTSKGTEVAVEGCLIQSSCSINGKVTLETYIQVTEMLILTKEA